jgi:hypothetical protein
MLYKHFGAGFQATLQPTLQNYGPLQYRQLLYDVDGIYQPIATKRVSLRLQGGSGAHTGFSISQSGCVARRFAVTIRSPLGPLTILP